MELYSNKNSIESIELHDKKVNHGYKYVDRYIKVKIKKPWYKQLFTKPQYEEILKKGFVDNSWLDDVISDKQLQYKSIYTEDEIYDIGYLTSDSSEIEPKVYYKPYIKLIFNSGKEYTKQFNSYEEMVIFSKILLNKNRDVVKFL